MTVLFLPPDFEIREHIFFIEVLLVPFGDGDGVEVCSEGDPAPLELCEVTITAMIVLGVRCLDLLIREEDLEGPVLRELQVD